MDESSRDKSDLEGKVDCEKGVIGDARLADVLAAPAEFTEKDVLSWSGA